jgi:hypothetical protein
MVALFCLARLLNAKTKNNTEANTKICGITEQN